MVEDTSMVEDLNILNISLCIWNQERFSCNYEIIVSELLDSTRLWIMNGIPSLECQGQTGPNLNTWES